MINYNFQKNLVVRKKEFFKSDFQSELLFELNVNLDALSLTSVSERC